MIGVDTNVLLRYLVGDDPTQASRVARFLVECRERGEAVHICGVVLCEAAWVLQTRFQMSRSEILAIIERLLESEGFQVERADIVRTALQQCRQGSADFADYLIGQLNLAEGCRSTVTFDRALRQSAGFRLLQTRAE